MCRKFQRKFRRLHWFHSVCQTSDRFGYWWYWSLFPERSSHIGVWSRFFGLFIKFWRKFSKPVWLCGIIYAYADSDQDQSHSQVGPQPYWLNLIRPQPYWTLLTSFGEVVQNKWKSMLFKLQTLQYRCGI